MTDVVLTVPRGLWEDWLEEGDLPGERWSGMRSHFWIALDPLPDIAPGERVYIVAHGKVRGYAPLAALEQRCSMRGDRACLMRYGGAVACTVNCYETTGCAHGGPEHPALIRGFRGWRYVWWTRDKEMAFPDWRRP